MTTDRHAEYDKGKLFVLSVLALTTAGISFSLRSSVAEALRTTFFDPIDKLHSAEMIGAALGVAFLGFAFTIAVASPMLDALGMGRVLQASSLCFIAGTLTVVFASALSGPLGIYRTIWLGMLLTGIGWGLVETAINPLAATLYPEDKTHRLNVLHAWWPMGIVIGGLIGLAVGQLDMSWQAKLGVVVIPAVAYGIGLVGAKFPPTERVAAGVSSGEMFREVARPLFVVWFLSMFLTAASELAPGQWVDMALDAHGGLPRHLAAHLRQRPHVRDAALRGAPGPQAVARRPPLVLVPPGVGGARPPEHRQLAGDRSPRGHDLGRRRLLHVADDAGRGLRALPARGCALSWGSWGRRGRCRSTSCSR